MDDIILKIIAVIGGFLSPIMMFVGIIFFVRNKFSNIYSKITILTFAIFSVICYALVLQVITIIFPQLTEGFSILGHYQAALNKTTLSLFLGVSFYFILESRIKRS
jgi:hypothetical protein